MSYGGNSGNSTSTQEVPEWLRGVYQSNVARAQGVADQPFTPYGGQLAAGDNDYMAAARDQAVGGSYAGRGQMDQAENVYSGIADQSPFFHSAAQTGDIIDVNPERASAGAVAGSNLAAYTNPYENQVVQSTLGDIDLQRQRSLNDSNASTPRGAFGGSRQGVSDSLTNEAFGRQSAASAAQLRQQGYAGAQGLLASDLDRLNQNSQFNAAQGNAAQTQNANLDYAARNADANRLQDTSALNASIDQANTGYNLQAAGGLQQSAQQRQNQANTSAGLLSSLGGQLQGTQQSGLDAAYNEFMRQQQQPYQQQQLLNSSVLGINAGGTTTTNSKAKGGSL